MAFCSNCGNPYEGNVAFCPTCGQALGGAAVAPQPAFQQPMYQQPMNAMQMTAQARQDALNEMAKMIDYFGQKTAQYDRYDYLSEMIPRKMHVQAVPLLVFGIIITLVGMIVLGSAGAGGLIPLFIGLGMIGGFVALNINRKKTLNQMFEEYAALGEELATHYQNYGFCLVGMEYSNPAILQSVAQVISVGRADSPKEAINVLLDDLHKDNMEALATQTAINSASAASGSRVAAGFAAASFFLR